MSEITELTKKYQTIQKDLEEAKTLRTQLEERKKNVEKQLTTLVDKIKAQGYDPKNLKKIRDEKVEELTKLVTEKESEVKEVLNKLKTIDVETSL
jgi:uncharacterized protein (UPF0335 family)